MSCMWPLRPSASESPGELARPGQDPSCSGFWPQPHSHGAAARGGGHREAEARNPVAVRVTDQWPPVGKGAAAHGTWPIKEKMSVGSINQCAETQNHRRGKGHL